MMRKIYYSHPNILLKEHLKTVGESVVRKCEFLEKKYPLLHKVAKIIGLTHDFGKYTSFFQKHLMEGIKDVKSHHSLLSALFCVYQVNKFLEKNPSSFDSHVKRFLPLISYMAVYRHHGDLKHPEEIIPRKKEIEDYPDLKNIRNKTMREEILALKEQIEDIHKNISDIEKETEEIGLPNLEEFLNKKMIISIFSQLDTLRYELIEKNELNDTQRIELYFLTLLLFSLLIDSDKRSAGRDRPIEIERKNIESNLVDIYIEKELKTTGQNEINKIRNEIYQKVIDRVSEIELNQRLFTLTAPTGSGKTLTALSFALKLREKLEGKESGIKPRIIYSLPFINILEQNYEVFKKVLSSLSDFDKNISSFLIKHHHLSPIEYKEDDEFKPLDEALLLVESWESEIIITTFVQLLHSVIGFKKSFLKKIHNLVGSIIILDEVQCIPVEYWELVDKVLKYLAEFLDCRIVLMTATRPSIFSSSGALELVPDYQNYFSSLNRITLLPEIKEEMSDEEFIDWFKNIYSQDNKSFLIVVNTIRKSIDVYRLLKERLNLDGFIELEKNGKERMIKNEEHLLQQLDKGKISIFYLSTNITPIQRAVRINILKKFMEKGGKPILVSTQVVEAGVDLDFDVVIRDIGPLDSIIQCGGRCNRSALKEKGKLYVVRLENGGANLVYGKIHPYITQNLLNKEEIEERDFLELIDLYFSEIKKRISQDKSKDIYDSIRNLNFYHKDIPSIKDFKLIEEKGEFYDIYVELDKKSQEIKEKFLQDVIKNKDSLERRRNYFQIRKDFFEYLIQVREEKLKKNLPVRIQDTEFFFIPYEQIDEFYDLETGYKFQSNSAIIW